MNKINQPFKSERLKVLFEQIILSGVNFIVLILLARELAPEEWGVYSLGFALVIFFQGFQRAFVILPFITMTYSQASAYRNRSFWLGLQIKVTLISLAMAFMLSLVSGIFDLESLQNSLWISMILMPMFFFHEFFRRFLLQTGRLGRLLVLSTVYSLITLFSLGIALVYQLNIYSFSLLMLALSSVYFGAFNSFSRIPKLACTTNTRRIDILSYGRWSSLAHLAFSGYNTGIQVILTVFAGPAAMGVFAALRNMIQPVQTIISTVDSLDKPKGARAYKQDGLNGMFEVLVGTLKVLLIVGSVYLFIVSVLGESIINLIYNEQYSEYSSELNLWLVVALLMLLTVPLESSIYIMKEPKTLVVIRFISSGLALLLAFLLIPSMGVSGALWSLICGWFVSLLLSLIFLVKVRKRAAI